jgi:hypothetical protein
VVGEADVFVVLAEGHDAISKADGGRAAAQFVHFEGGGGAVCDVEAFAVAVRCEEDVLLLLGVDGLNEAWVEGNDRAASCYLRFTRILEPVLRGLDGRVATLRAPPSSEAIWLIVPVQVKLPLPVK